MTTGPRRLLVVGRDAADGPEARALLGLVEALGAGPGPELRVLLQSGGPLVDRFTALAPTTVVAGLTGASPGGVAERVLGRAGLTARALAVRGRRLGLDGWGTGDGVYLHSVLCVQVLRYLPAGAGPVLCRVPEAAHPLHHPLSAADLALLLDRVDRFLAATAIGVEELTADRGLAPDRVVRWQEAVAAPPADLGPDDPGRLDELRARLGLRAGDVVVGSFGASAIEPPSPVTSLAVALRRLDSPARLLCVAPEHASDGWAAHDVDHAGLGDRALVVQAAEPLPPYAALCDLVVHAGWGPDHPFPYLDAMARGRPVVCFEGHELAGLVGADEAGAVCPYLDLEAMAARVADLAADAETRAARGAVAASRVAEAHGVAGAASELRRQLADAAAVAAP